MVMADSYPKHDVFQAIADPTRREILSLIADKEMPVTTICGHFDISRTAVSKHLHILADAGLVTDHRVGREVRYKLQPEPLMELKRWLSYYERFWDQRLDALKKFVEDNKTEL